jgi:hypothetical protein
MAMVGLGCGDSSSKGVPTTPAALRLQRADLVVVSRGLNDVERSIRQELSASRAAWPLIVHGLPTQIAPALRTQILTARTQARRVAKPLFMAEAKKLTGPAAGLAALLRSFSGLIERGWALTEASIAGVAAGPPSTAEFLRANVGLYINCIYDGHYDLAAIGKTLQRAYVKLGGAPAFGQSLTPTEVDAIAGVYSPASARLEPRPAERLVQ